MQVVVDDPEALACVVTAVCSAHQVLNHQTHIDQSDLVVRREIPLKNGNINVVINQK